MVTRDTASTSTSNTSDTVAFLLVGVSRRDGGIGFTLVDRSTDRVGSRGMVLGTTMDIVSVCHHLYLVISQFRQLLCDDGGSSLHDVRVSE